MIVNDNSTTKRKTTMNKKTMPKDSISAVAQAERILNQTLAYHAAIAVHEVRDRLNLSVQEIRLAVSPLLKEAPGHCRVTCTITSVALPERAIPHPPGRPAKTGASAPAQRDTARKTANAA